ncbi:MAG: hypothetical protein D6732_10365 [Methanobacteriota archaeon]|nr:MAG: hypothetical protein D6732_10365 [Euryarchaeota archaeon]
MHRRLLKGEWGKWMKLSFLMPFLTVAGYLLVCRYLIDAYELWADSRWALGLELVGVAMLGLFVGISASPEVRTRSMSILRLALSTKAAS